MEFEILLGECGMASSSEKLNGNNFIKFTQAFSFGKPPANDFSVRKRFFEINRFEIREQI